MSVALSVGVQKMVRSDRASAGVIFTLDPETGHRGVVLVTSSCGLGESVVQGRVAPDQFVVHKATLKAGFAPIVWKKLGTKEVRLVYDEEGHKQVQERARPGRRPRALLAHATTTCSRSRAGRRRSRTTTRASDGADVPMDIEWAKDGVSGELFVVQARPETVHSRRAHPKLHLYTMKERAHAARRRGSPSATASCTGKVRVLRDPRQARRASSRARSS